MDAAVPPRARQMLVDVVGAGTPPHAGGGGSQSPAAVQLTADVFGLPVARIHTHEAAGLGAAIDASVGLAIHRDIDSAVAAMVHVGEVRDPDHADQARYDDLYRSVYRRMYGRLRPLCQEIRRITGYPPG